MGGKKKGLRRVVALCSTPSYLVISVYSRAAALLGQMMMIIGRYPKAPLGLLCRRFCAGLVNDNGSMTKVNGANNEARLLLAGPDASGIVASFSHLLFSRGCGIVDCTSESSEIDAESRQVDQHSQRRMFFQRILFDHSNVSVERDVIEDEINDLCVRFGMKSQLVRITCPSNSCHTCI